jgi:transcriptional regulator with XRE-family HTH domain
VFLGRLTELEARHDGNAGRAAKAAGIDEGQWSEWKSGKRAINPKLDTIVGLARALGLTPGEVISDPPDEADRAERERAIRAAADEAASRKLAALQDALHRALDAIAESTPKRARGRKG